MNALVAFLGRNRSLKILSLFLAVALWLAVGGEERTETNLNIHLELHNLPPDLMVTSEIPSYIQVRVSGPRGLIRSLTQSRLTHSLDLTGIKPGKQSFPLGVGSFNFPRGVQVIRVQPNPLVLTFTPTVTRTLPVQPVFLGRPPEGYEVKSVKTRPAKVRVKGPESELEDLKFLPTVPLDLTHLTSSTTLSTTLNFQDLHISMANQVPILADVEITPKILKRTFERVPVVAQPLPAKLSPDEVAITLEGPWLQVKNLEAQELKASVSTVGLAPGRHRLKVQVQLPEGLTLEKVSPPYLTVRLDKNRD
uniref:YbbR family protein n=1 Tax=Desulfobacca acetoxidans TaxID=60893 RepID=A0A7C3ZAA3_9BACT